MLAIETFEQTEQTTDEFGNSQAECDVEAMELIEKLGLDGQRELNTPKEAGAEPTRFPYREMTATERTVYGVLCPEHTKLQAYKGGAIPTRVLQVAAHAQEFFDEIYVWSVRTSTVKDPVLVGHKKNVIETWRGPTLFILARWGDVLEPFEELTAKAVKSLRALKKSAAKKIISKAQAFLSAIDSMPDEEVLREKDEPCAFHLD